MDRRCRGNHLRSGVRFRGLAIAFLLTLQDSVHVYCKAAADTGFHVTQVSGDWSRTAFTDASPLMIFEARRS